MTPSLSSVARVTMVVRSASSGRPVRTAPPERRLAAQEEAVP